MLKAEATGPRVPAIMGKADEANHHRLAGQRSNGCEAGSAYLEMRWACSCWKGFEVARRPSATSAWSWMLSPKSASFMVAVLSLPPAVVSWMLTSLVAEAASVEHCLGEAMVLSQVARAGNWPGCMTS